MIRSNVFKVILIGEGGVGKTSIVLKYTEDRFEDKMKMTIGVNFATKPVEIAGKKITLMLWDLGGQPRFRDVVGEYFRGSRLALAVYDVTRKFQLYALDDWIRRLKDSSPDAELLFVGNKIDLRQPGEGVTFEEASEFASKYNAPCMEVSAKTGEGIDQMFDYVAKILIEKYLSE